MQIPEFNVTLAIIIITSIVSISAFSNEKIKNDLMYYPPAVTYRKQWYRFFTCGLVHADWPHLIFNMLTLYFFGGTVEAVFNAIFGSQGKFIFLLMYVLALFFSLLPTHLKHKNNAHYASLGASGAVAAVMFAVMLLAPGQGIGFLFLPVQIPGFIFAPLYIAISIWLDKRGRDNINHSAHLFGALFGLGFVIIVSKLVVDFDAVSWCMDRIRDYISDL